MYEANSTPPITRKWSSAWDDLPNKKQKRIQQLRKKIKKNKNKSKKPTPRGDILEDCGLVNIEEWIKAHQVSIKKMSFQKEPINKV